MKELFIERNFRKASQDQIAVVNGIIEQYVALGYRLSLRQLYYQLVSRDLIANNQKEYKKLGQLLSDARLAGLVDWDAIEDRGRETHQISTWENPQEIIQVALRSFRIDKWDTQPVHIEVVVEKDALSGVLRPVCERLGVPFSANRGYPSSSFLYEMGKRLAGKYGDGKDIIILHLGDHDPSGVDMTKDVDERLCMFSGTQVTVERIALNMPQVEEYQPPPNTAKETDTRFKMYAARYGRTCWELDAIEPTTLAALVTTQIEQYIDRDAWEEAEQRENEMKDELRKFAKNSHD